MRRDGSAQAPWRRRVAIGVFGAAALAAAYGGWATRAEYGRLAARGVPVDAEITSLRLQTSFARGPALFIPEVTYRDAAGRLQRARIPEGVQRGVYRVGQHVAAIVDPATPWRVLPAAEVTAGPEGTDWAFWAMAAVFGGAAWLIWRTGRLRFPAGQSGDGDPSTG